MAMSDELAGSRTRTFSWHDPLATAEASRRMNGLEYLRAMARGDLPRPPIASTLNYDLVEVDDGRAVFELTPAEFHCNPFGVLHGGVATTLLDSAMACAIHTRLPAGAANTTIELKVNFVRPITTQTGRLRCEADVLHLGRRISLAQARLVDAQHRLYAHATTTCMISRD
jgi:uncharacterized protein (TIGR00369 family)